MLPFDQQFDKSIHQARGETLNVSLCSGLGASCRILLLFVLFYWEMEATVHATTLLPPGGNQHNYWEDHRRLLCSAARGSDVVGQRAATLPSPLMETCTEMLDVVGI